MIKLLKTMGFLFIGIVVIAACTPAPQPVPTAAAALPPTGPTPGTPTMETLSAPALFQKGGCGACHVIPGIPGAVGKIGPDLTLIGILAEEHLAASDYGGKATDAMGYLLESITDPDAAIAPDCGGVPCQKGLMSATLADLYTAEELETMVAFMAALTGEEVAVVEEPEVPVDLAIPELSDEDFAKAKQVFFDRCAGCHGVLRHGATGPALTPDKTLLKGTLALASIIYNGTPRGMPDWGKQGVLTQEEAEMMAKYIQIEPPAPPEMSLEQMREFWQVFVPVEERPTEPQHERDWENFFAVTLRDAGQIAVIDGDTYEVVETVDTGYAVHISRMSATGRYVYTIGRDGKTALVDLWMEKPTKVAEIKTCYDARSVEVSKYSGELGDFTDRYAIVGCYWPPHFVILDGLTLEPLKVVSTRSYTYDTNEYHPEPRVASIVASHFKPQWVVNIKETGLIWLVDYTDVFNPAIKMLEAERFLHDGGWDASRRYFLVAANNADRVVVLDALEERVAAIVDTPAIPHPGRGANWIDPVFGPVWSTAHLGEGLLIAIATDPENYPENAWKVVRTIPVAGGGSLFVKTHPLSDWIWVDHALNSDAAIQRTVCVIAKSDPTKTHKCWEASDYGRAVHMEYNRQGTEVWISIWGRADEPGRVGEIVVYNDKTLEEIARIPNLVTPTGKFNVYNTVNDIY